MREREGNEAHTTRTGQRRGYRLIAHRGFTLVRMHFYRLRRWVSEVCLFLSFAVERARGIPTIFYDHLYVLTFSEHFCSVDSR